MMALWRIEADTEHTELAKYVYEEIYDFLVFPICGAILNEQSGERELVEYSVLVDGATIHDVAETPSKLLETLYHRAATKVLASEYFGEALKGSQNASTVWLKYHGSVAMQHYNNEVKERVGRGDTLRCIKYDLEVATRKSLNDDNGINDKDLKILGVGKIVTGADD
jgi:hypothetical protein